VGVLLFIPAPLGGAQPEHSSLAPGYWLNFEQAMLADSPPVVLLDLDYDRLRGQPSVLRLDVGDVVDEPSHELYRCSTRRSPFGTQHAPRAARQRGDVLRHDVPLKTASSVVMSRFSSVPASRRCVNPLQHVNVSVSLGTPMDFEIAIKALSAAVTFLQLAFRVRDELAKRKKPSAAELKAELSKQIPTSNSPEGA